MAAATERVPMQLRLLEKQKDSVRIEVSNPDDTLIHPLVAALLKDSEVADALYYSGHPQLDKPVLTIRVKKGSPQAALKRAAQNLSDEFSTARSLLEKELR
jgi:DNA-directed RNA polymerase subunit L